jgi:predicted nucleic acid-binding Zn ribbon protein
MKNNDLYQLTESDILEFDELFNRTLTEDEFYILKAKIELDEIYKHKFRVYRALRKEIEEEAISSDSLKNRLSKLKKKVRRKRMIHFYISSLLIVFVLFLGINYWLNKPDLNQEVYSKYKNIEVGLSLKMNAENPKMIDSAMYYFANIDYDKALYYLKKAPKSDSVDFYIAYCNEMLENSDLAIDTYQDIIKKSSIRLYQDKAKFRLALMYLKDKNKKFKDLFKEIAEDDSNAYKELAADILKSIKG